MSRDPKPGVDRPLSLLIAALGGEGGGLLADWIIAAADSEDVPVQSTSIPGVAQRTGATTYYMEMMKPAKRAKRAPVFALYPAPGHVDIVAASELVEAGRAIENGFVTPDRTVLISSSHRVFSMQEKVAMGDGEFQSQPILDAAEALSKRPVIGDMAAYCDAQGVMLNSVLLGTIAGAGLCPISDEAFRQAICERGVAVESNLKGFEAGKTWFGNYRQQLKPQTEAAAPRSDDSFAARIAALPDDAQDFASEGVSRLIGYQDRAYAGLYLDHLERVLEVEQSAGAKGRNAGLVRETARYLALWMAYEDVIRVADLKTHPDRYFHQVEEVRAKPGEPLQVTEYFKPGIDELTSVMPAWLGRMVVNWADKKPSRRNWHMAMHVRSDTIFGYLRLRMVARMKFMRRRGIRFKFEQEQIEKWLDAVTGGGAIDPRLGAEIVACARLIKGYSDTRQRGYRNLEAIFAQAITPALNGEFKPGKAVRLISRARDAALGDEEGKALAEVLEAA